MEGEEDPQPDFSHIPTDALIVVLSHVFSPDRGAALPLSLFIERWTAVRLTCKHWDEVLVAHPPPLALAVSTLPEAWVPWLLALPLRALCIEEGADPLWSQPAEDEDEGEQQAGGGPPAGMPALLDALQLVAGLEGAGLPQPFWALAPLSQLQHLHLLAPVSGPEAPAVFDSAALQGLGQLTLLSLGCWADYRLEALPPSLRRLHLHYDTLSRTLRVPRLPEHASLDWLRLEAPGALGLCIDDLWAQVAALEVRAAELLLGVAVTDRRLIATFERPYREGSFVPPHIWGDEEADDHSKGAADMAANHWLAVLPSCPRLRKLTVEGGCAASVKFAPVAPHAAASLQWLWSVVRLQGLHNLLGLSGQEMEARQQLIEDRLRFSCTRPAAAAAAAAGVAWQSPGATEPFCCVEVVPEGAAVPAGPDAA